MSATETPTAPPPPYEDNARFISEHEDAGDQTLTTRQGQQDVKCIEGPSSGSNYATQCCTSDAELLRSELELTMKYPVKIPSFSSAFEEANVKLSGYYKNLRILEGREPRILAIMKFEYERDDVIYDYIVLDLKNGERNIDVAARYKLNFRSCRFDGIIEESDVKPFVSALTGFDNALANYRRAYGLHCGVRRKGWIRFQYVYAWEFKVGPKESAQLTSSRDSVSVLYLKNCFTGEGAFAAPDSSTLFVFNNEYSRKEASSGCVIL